jgi:hypothetical protein
MHPMAQDPKDYTSAKTVVTDSCLVISLNEEQQKRAQECLDKTGKITLNFREVAVTQLPGTVSADVIVD